MEEIENIYTPSVKLNNRVELEHYCCAREFLEKMGPENIDAPKDFFKDYDEIKEDFAKAISESGDEDEDYVKHSLELTSNRAIELIDLALEDFKNDPESLKRREQHEKAVPKSWNRSGS